MSKLEGVTIEPGFITIATNSGPPTRYPIANVVRAVDVPALTYTQVASLSALANLVAILIRTLIARDVLDEAFLEEGEFNLDDIIEALGNMGGDYGDPDLTSASS